MKKSIYFLLILILIVPLSFNCNPGGGSGGGGGDTPASITKIIFHRFTHDNAGENYYNIFTMDIDGSNVEQITFGDNDYQRAHFSPDGTKIVFTDFAQTDDSEIMIMDSDGTNIIQLTTNAIADSDADFSANGKKIIFHRFTHDNAGENYYNIFTMDIDGSNVEQITFGDNDYQRAHFSPDGTKIVFTDFAQTDDSEIVIMDSDGSDIIQLTTNAIADSDADFY